MEGLATSESAANIRPIKRSEFQHLQNYVLEHSGIYLPPTKKALLVGRLARRLRALGLDSFGDYFQYLVSHEDTERALMIDRICTNETSFFREPQQFEFLHEEIFPRWRENAYNSDDQRTIRAWSAGCSTGEEPYSLAMALLDNFPPSAGWQVEIWATDLSTQALERAKAARWPISRSSDIPQVYAKRFMLRGRGAQEGVMKARPVLRNLIRFERLNLTSFPYPGNQRYDLIFCRNVLIYFQKEMRLRIVDHLIDRLSERGLLHLGHAESLFGQTGRVQGIMPSVYCLRPSFDDESAS